MKEDKKKVFIRTLGWPMNIRDIAGIFNPLRKITGFQARDRALRNVDFASGREPRILIHGAPHRKPETNN